MRFLFCPPLRRPMRPMGASGPTKAGYPVGERDDSGGKGRDAVGSVPYGICGRAVYGGRGWDNTEVSIGVSPWRYAGVKGGGSPLVQIGRRVGIEKKF